MIVNYEVKFTTEEKEILSKFIKISCKGVTCAKCPFFSTKYAGICFKEEIHDSVEELLNESRSNS